MDKYEMIEEETELLAETSSYEDDDDEVFLSSSWGRSVCNVGQGPFSNTSSISQGTIQYPYDKPLNTNQTSNDRLSSFS